MKNWYFYVNRPNLLGHPIYGLWFEDLSNVGFLTWNIEEFTCDTLNELHFDNNDFPCSWQRKKIVQWQQHNHHDSPWIFCIRPSSSTLLPTLPLFFCNLLITNVDSLSFTKSSLKTAIKSYYNLLKMPDGDDLRDFWGFIGLGSRV